MFPNGSGSQQLANGIAVASLNVRESNMTEYSGAVGLTTGVLAYKFIPKYQGEYRISAETKNTAGTQQAQLAAIFTNRDATTTYSNVQGLAAVNWTNTIGSVVSGLTAGVAVGKLTLGFNSTATYTVVTGTLAVIERMPIYIFVTANGNDTCFIRNLTISYDVIR